LRGNILHYSLDFSSITKINYRAAVTFGLESANVVGYQEKTINAGGFSMTTPTFKAITGNYKISDIKVKPKRRS
jgi:hypothetical protein